MTLPIDAAERKGIPMARGLLDYFPAALAEVARVSKAGNEKHNPGQEMHHARGKSMDHADCIVRHLLERGHMDTDGLSHTAHLAWRALALLQEELEAAGAPLARGARVPGSLVPLSASDPLMAEQRAKPIVLKADPKDYTKNAAENALQPEKLAADWLNDPANRDFINQLRSQAKQQGKGKLPHFPYDDDMGPTPERAL